MVQDMTLYFQLIGPLIVGFILDLLLGDPHWMYHPVRMIGNLITVTERIIRGCLPKTKKGERIGGVLLIVIVVAVSSAVPFGILYFVYGRNVLQVFL